MSDGIRKGSAMVSSGGTLNRADHGGKTTDKRGPSAGKTCRCGCGKEVRSWSPNGWRAICRKKRDEAARAKLQEPLTVYPEPVLVKRVG